MTLHVCIVLHHTAALPQGIGTTELGCCMQHVLLPAEVQWVLQCEHSPNACSLMLSSLVKQLDLPLFRAIEVDQNVTRLVDFYGGCERILKTPVPLSYTRYTSLQNLHAEFEDTKVQCLRLT